MSQAFFQVDAFTDRPFAGNPAAVYLLDEPRDEEWMLAVAREMNLSETAFLIAEGENRFHLRWFTPETEVDLCGHATLASAHILWETEEATAEKEISFSTRSGVLAAARVEGWIEMDFPSDGPVESEKIPDLEHALGTTPTWFGRSRLYYLALLDSEETLRSLRPDFSRLASLVPPGLSVTAESSSETFDFVSRFFAPAFGIDEDPVTGSAHCLLAPFWAERLGNQDLLGFQASSRGGVVRVGQRGDRVLISGQAVTVARAELL